MILPADAPDEGGLDWQGSSAACRPAHLALRAATKIKRAQTPIQIHPIVLRGRIIAGFTVAKRPRQSLG